MEHDTMLPEEIPAEDITREESREAPSAEEPVGEGSAPGEEADGGELSVGEPPVDYQRLESEDLLVLRAAVPELREATSLSALSDPGRYGELREAGLDPLEAYLATEGRRLLRRPRDNRTHLVSSLGRTASSAGGRISAAELHAARDLFPGLGDGEIEALWRRVGTTGRR